jgi:hypothetical protein
MISCDMRGYPRRKGGCGPVRTDALLISEVKAQAYKPEVKAVQYQPAKNATNTSNATKEVKEVKFQVRGCAGCSLYTHVAWAVPKEFGGSHRSAR